MTSQVALQGKRSDTKKKIPLIGEYVHNLPGNSAGEFDQSRAMSSSCWSTTLSLHLSNSVSTSWSLSSSQPLSNTVELALTHRNELTRDYPPDCPSFKEAGTPENPPAGVFLQSPHSARVPYEYFHQTWGGTRCRRTLPTFLPAAQSRD